MGEYVLVIVGVTVVVAVRDLEYVRIAEPVDDDDGVMDPVDVGLFVSVLPNEGENDVVQE